MLQKQVFLMRVCGTAITSLFLLTGCGEQKAKTTSKTAKRVVATVKSGKIQTKTIAALPNVAINPSFEEAKVFKSGLYKKGKYPTEKPVGWTTKGQILNDSSGWATGEEHTGKHSLKIENIGGTNAYWKGKAIIFKEPVNAFAASIWTQAKEIKDKIGKGNFQLAFDVYLKGDNNKEIKERVVIDIAKTVHNWKKTKGTALFATNIIKIVPYLYFSGMSGSVWFDDLNIVKREVVRGKNIIPNYDIEAGSGKSVNKWVLNRKTPGSIWHKSEGYKGSKSLKIDNDHAKGQVFWYLKEHIIINKPTKYYYWEGLVKAKELHGSKGDHTYVEVKAIYKDGSTSSFYPIEYPHGTYDWLKKSKNIVLKDYPDKMVVVLISSGKGTVWFDNISLSPLYIKSISPKK
jgi:hypothetical protein